jgi:peptide/nickel transport system permease protein
VATTLDVGVRRTQDAATPGPPSQALSLVSWYALLHDAPSAAAFIFIVLVIIASIAGPIISPYQVAGRDFSHSLLPPFTFVDGNFYIFGTDSIGRDLFTRILAGGRVSMSVAAATVVISGTIGVALGLTAGFYRGMVDTVIMRVVDVFMALPPIFFVLVFLYLVGSSTFNLIFVMAIARWTLYCRLVRGITLTMRETSFITAARTIGASNGRILVQHLLPNMWSSILTIGTLDVARVILLEASISFLGLGLQAPAVSWGILVATGRDHINDAWWLITIPGAVIFLTSLSINTFGTWLRMVNDPLHRWRYVPSN